MTIFGRVAFAMPAGALLLAASLAACGGGSGSPALHNQQAGSGVAVGEPAPVPLALTEFENMARGAACAETRNRLFIIDGKQVFWDHAGNCADASYEQILFGADPKTVLCSSGQTIAGPRTSCASEASRPLFETMTRNLDKADLGLGSAHKVEQVSFLPKAGTVFPFERVAKDSFSGVTTRKFGVIKDEAAWARLFAEHVGNRTPAPELPKIDWANKMLVAVFAGESGSGCHSIAITRVTAGNSSIKVEVDERELQTFDVCPAVVTHPMDVVAIDRSEINVEFVPASGASVPFKTLSQLNNSGVHEGRNVVIRDTLALQRLWAEHDPATLVPEIDFNRYIVVGVFMGGHTPCYSTEITGVVRDAGKIVVQRTDKEPPIGVMCAQMVTYPGHLVAIERSELPVEFETIVTQSK